MALGVEVEYNANVGNLRQGTDEAQQILDGFGSNAERIAGVAGKVLGVAAGASAFAAASIAAMTAKVITAAAEFDDLSQKTGISVENLAGLKVVSEQSGTSLDTTTELIGNLTVAMGKNGEELSRLGINANDPLQAFEQLSDVFNQIDDPQQRAALGAKILGDNWAEAVPLLSLGGQAIDDLVKKEGEASGMSKKLSDEAVEFNKSVDKLTTNISNLGTNAVAPLVPLLNDLFDFFSDNNVDINKAIGLNDALAAAYKGVAVAVGFLGTGLHIAGAGVEALFKKMDALVHLDFANFSAIDKAMDETVKNAEFKFFNLVDKIQGQGDISKIELPVDLQTTLNGKTASGVESQANKAVQEFLGLTKEEQDNLKQANAATEKALKNHLKGVERTIDEESSLYKYRNKQVEVALDLGLLSQEDYFAKKEQLQKDQLAKTQSLLDQEIDALKQFQSQSTDEAAKSNAQEKINDLLLEKTKLERDGQIATLENAAAAQQALGQYGESLVNVNELLQGVASNIIGISQAQAELNFKTPDTGPATAADLADPNTVFRSADGKSFSDRPTTVGVQLELEQDVINGVEQQIIDFKQQAIEDSAILLGIDIDQAAALAKFDATTGEINAKLAALPPVNLGMEINQDAVIASAKSARDAAQTAVQPVIVPVIFQATNSPNSPAPAGNSNFDLAQTALASGGR